MHCVASADPRPNWTTGRCVSRNRLCRNDGCQRRYLSQQEIIGRGDQRNRRRDPARRSKLADHTDVRTPCEEHVKIGLYPSVEWCEAERAVMVNGWQTAYERGRPGYALMMRGAVHASFMDAPFLPLQPGSMLAGGMAAASIDSERAWRITCDALLAFFGAHLDGEPATFFGAPFPTDEAVLGPPQSLLLGEPSADEHPRP